VPAEGTAQVTWIGHASTLVEVDGVRVLADPMLTRRLGHLRRRGPLPDSSARACDLVVISHAHADHLHRRSLRRVAAASPGVPVVVPRGTAAYVLGLGLGVVIEVSPGDDVEIAGVRLRVTDADHHGGRGRRDRGSTETVGYVVERAGRRCYFAGDTDLFDGMADLGPIDLACIPIFGWWKKLGPGHLDPERAAEAVARVAPAKVLPIHWGTLAPEDLGLVTAWLAEPGARFAAALAARGLDDRLLRLEPGQTAVW
jgi:L-ascorbate metabolism protein UlaG (beta-lactamase superfamily)